MLANEKNEAGLSVICTIAASCENQGLYTDVTKFIGISKTYEKLVELCRGELRMEGEGNVMPLAAFLVGRHHFLAVECQRADVARAHDGYFRRPDEDAAYPSEFGVKLRLERLFLRAVCVAVN